VKEVSIRDRLGCCRVSGGLLDFAELKLDENDQIGDRGGGHASEKCEVDFEESVGGDFDRLVDDLQGKLADLWEDRK
jgi:hypothetical protein